mmetsp:Transcript_44317/g.43010  ORF Transcript_44317/g.43010 Transcript_44317/m.43010 type:complete len:141 (+) Transcript_44317:1092-1514(+)
MRYIIMRLEFIHPIYLPPLSESFLRKDFNFAAYLGYAYGKTLQNFFNNSWVTLLLILVIVEIYKLVFFSNANWWAIMINMIIPIGFFFIYYIYFVQLTNIQKVLYPQILEDDGTLVKSEELNFNIFYDSIDPFALYSTYP